MTEDAVNPVAMTSALELADHSHPGRVDQF